jgi:hypothetical protein
MGGVPTKEEFEKWLRPRQALNLVAQYFFEFSHVPNAILGRLQGGAVQAAAVSSDAIKGSPVLIDNVLWSHLAMGNKPDWWDTGDVKVYRQGSQYRATFEGWFYGVRFEPTAINEIIAGRSKIVIKPTEATTAQLQPEVKTSAPKGASNVISASRAGRPRKDFWDDLIIATCRAIWLGDLKPQTQAEIERWMLDWASVNGHAISETSVKAPAKKVFNAFQD